MICGAPTGKGPCSQAVAGDWRCQRHRADAVQPDLRYTLAKWDDDYNVKQGVGGLRSDEERKRRIRGD